MISFLPHRRRRSAGVIALAFAVAVALMASPATAPATTFTSQLRTFNDLSPNFNSATNADLDSFLFDLFDPSLGTLLSVEVRTFISFEEGLAQLDSEALEPTTVELEFGTEADFTPNSVPFLRSDFSTIGDDVAASLSQTFDGVGANDGDHVLSFQDDGGFDNRDLPGPATGAPVSNTDNGFIADALIGAYAGPGTFTVDYSAATLFNLSSTGSVSGAFSPGIVDGSVEIIYEYAPAIPEPGTGLLLVTGTIFVCGRRQGRRRR